MGDSVQNVEASKKQPKIGEGIFRCHMSPTNKYENEKVIHSAHKALQNLKILISYCPVPLKMAMPSPESSNAYKNQTLKGINKSGMSVKNTMNATHGCQNQCNIIIFGGAVIEKRRKNTDVILSK